MTGSFHARAGLVVLALGATLVPGCRNGHERIDVGGSGGPLSPGAPAGAAGASDAGSAGGEDQPGTALGLSDTGIFGDLDGEVTMGIPACADPGAASLATGKTGTLSLLIGHVPVKTYPILGTGPVPGEDAVVVAGSCPDGIAIKTASGKQECIPLRPQDAAEVSALVTAGTIVKAGIAHDADGDGIPDEADVHVGALKCALNADSYDSGYFKIAYPLGDVPRDKGCCSDVVVRALRNAGIDLQDLVQKDIAARPGAYGHVDDPNPSIDHRRVRNLLVYMKKHFADAGTSLDRPCDWLPGDIVLLDTLPKKGPDHIGIVTWKTNEDGLPLVINNWTWGYSTGAMDLLSWVPVTHHFRLH